MPRTAILLFWLAAAAAGGETEPVSRSKDASKLVDECLTLAPDDARRKELVHLLRDVQPLPSRKLAAAITDPSKRSSALALAIELRAPGLLNEAKLCLKTDDEDLALKLLFLSQDPKTHKLLFDLWKTEDTSGTTFTLLCQGFCRYPTSGTALTGFKPFLEPASDEKRRAHAAAILKAQMSLDTDDPEEILKQWAKLWPEYQSQAKVFPVAGLDLLSTRPWQARGGQPIGPNYRLEKDGVLALLTEDLPASIQKGDFTLKMRIMVLDGEGAQVMVAIKSQETGKVLGFFPVYKDGEWAITTGDQKQIAMPGKRGEWVTITHEVHDNSSGTVRFDRRCNILVGEKKLLENGNFSGEFSEIAIGAGSGSLVVGGIELIRK